MRLTAKCAWVRPPHIAVLIAFCALGFDVALGQEPGTPGLEGRWENAKQDLVLDVARCGERYCGRIVTSGDQCAQTVLTVLPKAASPQVSQPAFEGRTHPARSRSPLQSQGHPHRRRQDADSWR